MVFSLTQFQNSAGPDQLSALDNNVVTLSAAAPISCGIAGTNTLTLTPNAAGLVPSSTLAAYTQNQLFTGVAASTNTGPVTAMVGAIGAINVYKDTASGPALLTGQEIIALTAISLRYDSALNSDAGGFHLFSSTAISNSAISPGANSSLTNLLSGTSPSLSFTATPGWSSQDQTFSVTAALASALPALGDFVMVNPPSLGAAGIDYRGYISGTGVFSVSLGSASFSNVSVATVNIRLTNAASASLAANSGAYRYVAQRYTP
jgi:hypothetical protein